MDEFFQMRAYWISATVVIGIFVPMVALTCWFQFRTNKKQLPLPFFIGIIAYFMFMISYGPNAILPKKYEVEYKKVYQCGYVDTMVPKYPDLISEE